MTTVRLTWRDTNQIHKLFRKVRVDLGVKAIGYNLFDSIELNRSISMDLYIMEETQVMIMAMHWVQKCSSPWTTADQHGCPYYFLVVPPTRPTNLVALPVEGSLPIGRSTRRERQQGSHTQAHLAASSHDVIPLCPPHCVAAYCDGCPACEPDPVWARSGEPAVLPAQAKARHVSPCSKSNI